MHEKLQTKDETSITDNLISVYIWNFFGKNHGGEWKIIVIISLW